MTGRSWRFSDQQWGRCPLGHRLCCGHRDPCGAARRLLCSPVAHVLPCRPGPCAEALRRWGVGWGSWAPPLWSHPGWSPGGGVNAQRACSDGRWLRLGATGSWGHQVAPSPTPVFLPRSREGCRWVRAATPRPARTAWQEADATPRSLLPDPWTHSVTLKARGDDHQGGTWLCP